MFNFADGTSCTIHTSCCSVPLVAGDQIGPFLVIAGSGELGFECDDIDQIQPPSPTVPTTSVPTTPTPLLPTTPPTPEECDPVIYCGKNDEGLLMCLFGSIIRPTELCIPKDFVQETLSIGATCGECPNDPPSTSPTFQPTTTPNFRPTLASTPIQTLAPAPSPTLGPTPSPTLGPSLLPVTAPTDAPVSQALTEAPLGLPPTEAPITLVPSSSPTSQLDGCDPVVSCGEDGADVLFCLELRVRTVEICVPTEDIQEVLPLGECG